MTSPKKIPRRFEKFAGEMGDSKFLSNCATCKHKHLGKVSCTAFPSGIPDDILTGRVRHTRPYPGDNGIQYEPLEGDDAS